MMKESFCLGLCGQKQVGKDTCFDIIYPILSKHLNTTFEKVAFADAVKNLLCLFHYKDEINNKYQRVTREFIEQNKENNDYVPKGWECNIRWALCNIGDRFREINPDIWIDIALLNNNKDKIITDIRYPNEAIKIRSSKKGLVVKIIRPEKLELQGHRSETSMIEIDKYLPVDYEGPLSNNKLPYDYLLLNNGTIEELKEKIMLNLIPFILDKWKYFN